jgi:hypothetical protein
MAKTDANGVKIESEKSVVLDGAKDRFAKRDKPANEKEVKAALVAYFKADDEIKALQDKISDLNLKRTELTKEVVALRGASQVNIAGRGVGRVMARADSAWITFPTADAGPALSLS